MAAARVIIVVAPSRWCSGDPSGVTLSTRSWIRISNLDQISLHDGWESLLENFQAVESLIFSVYGSLTTPRASAGEEPLSTGRGKTVTAVLPREVVSGNASPKCR